jgi:hypothetical protein
LKAGDLTLIFEPLPGEFGGFKKRFVRVDFPVIEKSVAQIEENRLNP